MKAHVAIIQIEQLLRGIAAECNRNCAPNAGLHAQTALVAVDGLHTELDTNGLDDMEFEPIKSVDDDDAEAESVPSGARTQ